jgi:23S rRNA (cytidine1920-2'-O)/16S rRNA (cytidine1409-2'-O)-methyltransferase
MGRTGGDGGKRRLDSLLFERGLAVSRGEARGLIMAGRVFVDGVVADKPGRPVGASADLRVEYPPHRYVSRGGVKLEKALDLFGLDVSGLACLDIGASTGGFTDCLLTRGAARVYALDVGYGLLAWKLRTDPRVVALDRTNARYLDRPSFEAAVRAEGREVVWPAFATCDVSFISLLKVVPAVIGLMHPSWHMVLLVKPQFETCREKVGSRGVVRDPEVHVEVLERLIREFGSRAAGLTHSPLRGPEGNIEYLLWLRDEPARPEAGSRLGPAEIRRTVEGAFASAPEG